MSSSDVVSSSDLSQFLQGKTKEELVQMLMKMTSSNAVELSGFEKGELIDTTNEYQRVMFDGYTLIPEELVAIGYDTSITCDLSPEAWKRVAASRQVVDNIVVRYCKLSFWRKNIVCILFFILYCLYCDVSA